MATTLFPPEVLIDQPTQIYGKENVYYLYFSFSQFNTMSDIAAVQITLRDISNNNIIKSEEAPYGIYQFCINDIHQKENNNMYYIGISDSWLTKSSENTQFKFQIRFVSAGSESPKSHSDYNFPTWISKNSGRLSEWSEVGILQLTEAFFSKEYFPKLNLGSPSKETFSKLTLKEGGMHPAVFSNSILLLIQSFIILTSFRFKFAFLTKAPNTSPASEPSFSRFINTSASSDVL